MTTSDAWTPARAAYTHAAVMGDLVSSGSAESAARLHAAFNAAVDEVNAARRGQLVSPLTITLGDEFQGLCACLSDGLAIVRALRLRLLDQDVECRFALGVVRIETPVNAERAWNMMGEGLSATRGRLSEKRHPNAYRFHLPGEDLVARLVEAVCYSLTLTERDWTRRQRQLALAVLASAALQSPLAPAELAAGLGLARRTYYKIRSAARLDFYVSQWSSVEAAMLELDRRYGFA